MDKIELLKSYHSHLIALERRAPLTAETYGFEIRRFLEWLEAEKLTVNSYAPNEADFSDVTDYVKYRKTVDKIDSRSVAKAVSALKSFYRFLAEERLLSRASPEGESAVADRVSLLETPRAAKRFPAVLKSGEAEKLFSLIDTSEPLGIRNRAIYDFIFSAGVRVSEVVNLNIEDVILNERVAHVRGKGSKERIVIFGEESAAWLSRYLNEVRPLFLKHRRSSAFFVSRKGKRLSRKGIWKHYSTLASQNGTDTRLHTLRHTFATELLAGGADLRSVQELLGHADLATTQIYTHVDSSVLRENHRQFLPQLKSWRET